MRYVIARYQSQRRDLAYRIYVSECLRIISKNTAKMGGGEFVERKFSDIINPKPKDERSGEEIVADIIERAGIEVIE